MVHYQNPKLVLGCVPEWEGRVLLCRRAIAPRLGFWTVPAGFMENGETLQQAAARECYEEAHAEVEIGSLLALVSVTHASQVHVMFRLHIARPDFSPGPESLEVALLRGGGHSLERIWRSRAENSRCGVFSPTGRAGARIITLRSSRVL